MSRTLIFFFKLINQVYFITWTCQKRSLKLKFYALWNDFDEIVDTLNFGISVVKFSFFTCGCACIGNFENQFKEYMYLNALKTENYSTLEGNMLEVSPLAYVISVLLCNGLWCVTVFLNSMNLSCIYLLMLHFICNDMIC